MEEQQSISPVIWCIEMTVFPLLLDAGKAVVGTGWAAGADCHIRAQALESVLGIMPSQRTSAMQLPLHVNNGFVVAT